MIHEDNQWPQEGQFVDFKDTNNEWVVGYIVGKTKDTVQVRSDGWASKYDLVSLNIS